MFTKEQCLAKVAEAEEMGALVSFGVDKERFRREAELWRRRAAEAPSSFMGFVVLASIMLWLK